MAGRPLKYQTAQEMQEAIDKYFRSCLHNTEEIEVVKDGKIVKTKTPKPLPLTMSGLAVAIGMDRTSLVNYSHREEFFDTVKRAKETVEADMELRMLTGKNNCIGSIFAFKNNFGWQDKRELDANVNLTIVDLLSALDTDSEVADK